MDSAVHGWISTNYLHIVVAGIFAFTVLILFFSDRKNRVLYRILIFLTGAIYLAALLYVTLGNRTPASNYNYNFKVFWSYEQIAKNGSRFLLWENIANVFAFLPLGMFLQELFEKRIKWFQCALGAGLLSMTIESAQLIFKLGLCEWDDVIHNTAGALLGYGLACLIKKACSSVSAVFHRNRS